MIGGGMESVTIGGRSVCPWEVPLLIAGPCTLEDGDDALRIADECAALAEREGFFYIFKSSYLKDNRSSIDSYTGPGLRRGLEMLARIRESAGCPVLTDVHCREEVGPAAEVCDVLQIPAFLSRQTRLITAAAQTGTVLNLKKGQHLSPAEMGLAVEKARRGGASAVLVTERGTFFGYHNLVVDCTSIPAMASLGVPVVFDATHSLQLPGGRGTMSGGRPEYARTLARAAVAAGCHGLFVETHFDPGSCRCDAEVMLPIRDLPRLLKETGELFRVVNGFET
jgi:2-dehydro-3-deoxyphosphooctonate aldolase (KDO 8-P synthase)